MLRIYPVCPAMVREVRPFAERIARFDRDLARQLRRSSTAVPLNVAEGSGLRAGRRRQAYEIALGEARETLANLEAAEAIGYVPPIDGQLTLMHVWGHRPEEYADRVEAWAKSVWRAWNPYHARAVAWLNGKGH